MKISVLNVNQHPMEVLKSVPYSFYIFENFFFSLDIPKVVKFAPVSPWMLFTDLKL